VCVLSRVRGTGFRWGFRLPVVHVDGLGFSNVRLCFVHLACIRFFNCRGKNKGDENSDSGANVVIVMDSLWELDANGRRAGNSNDNNGNKHAFNNFASKTFTFSPITTTTYMGAGCQQIVFNATGIQTDSSWLAVQVGCVPSEGAV
jgi:hypothetical protein